jgi:7-carboxy-7-deazaguanine synthase
MQLNSQEAEKRLSQDDTGLLDVHSIFPTLQGEGPFAGQPAVFIRLAGCNLQCPQCDTNYTTGRELHSVPFILERVNAVRGPRTLVVITGGEPFRQSIKELVDLLLINGYRVQIETNGTLWRPLPFGHPRLTIVCSPKTGAVHKHLLPHVDVFKYVASVRSLAMSNDGLPMSALDHPSHPHLFRKPPDHPAEVYLQPVDEQDPVLNSQNMEAVVHACMAHNHRLCLQLHKIVNLP